MSASSANGVLPKIAHISLIFQKFPSALDALDEEFDDISPEQEKYLSPNKLQALNTIFKDHPGLLTEKNLQFFLKAICAEARENSGKNAPLVFTSKQAIIEKVCIFI